MSPLPLTLPWSARWIAGSGLIGGLYLTHAAIFGGYVADDAGISLAYARNIAAGYGPVLYPGGEAVEAYSNPLWTAMLTAAVAVGLDGGDGVPLLKILGLLFGLATLLLSAAAARIVYPAGERVTWFAPALLAGLTPFVFWTTSGMENALYAFLLLLSAVLQLRELREPAARPWSALAVAGVALTRPEGIAFALAFLVHRILSGDGGRRLVAWALVAGGVYSLFLASRLLVFGEWVPNTYHAKVALYDRRINGLVTYLLDPADRGTGYAWRAAGAVWPLLIMAGAGLADWRHRRVGLLVAGVVGGTVLYVVYVGGDFWPAGRFFTATLPLLALAAQHAINRVPPRHATAAIVAAATIAGVALNRSIDASARLAVLDAGDALISLQGRLDTARRLQALAHALGIRDPLVMDPDIGGLAVAGLRVVDLGGLADIHIARFHWYPPFFRDYVFEDRRPDFIRTHSTWTASTGVTAFSEFESEYAAIRARRDARGLHGEFVRRAHLAGGGSARTVRPEARPPSWRQAIEDGRARRRREEARGSLSTSTHAPGQNTSIRATMTIPARMATDHHDRVATLFIQFLLPGLLQPCGRGTGDQTSSAAAASQRRAATTDARVRSFHKGGLGPASSISDSMARSLGSTRQVSTVQSS